jgi:hypothetical protein
VGGAVVGVRGGELPTRVDREVNGARFVGPAPRFCYHFSIKNTHPANEAMDLKVAKINCIVDYEPQASSRGLLLMGTC